MELKMCSESDCESENEVGFRIDSTTLVTKETNAKHLKHTTYSFDVLFIHCGMARIIVFFRSRLGD